MLKKKKYQDKLLEQLESHLVTVEGLISDVESAQIQVEVMKSLEMGNEALKQLNALMKLDDVEKILSDAQEAQEYQEVRRGALAYTPCSNCGTVVFSVLVLGNKCAHWWNLLEGRRRGNRGRARQTPGRGIS